MSGPEKWRWEIAVVVCATAALAVSLVVWPVQSQPRVVLAVGVNFRGGNFVPAAVAPAMTTAKWRAPTSANEDEWRFDLFTTPSVWRRKETGQWQAAAVLPSGWNRWQLTAVRHERYRVQFAGFVGREANGLAVFTADGQPGAWLGRAGQAWPAVGVELHGLERQTGGVVVARLRDLRSGQEVELNNQEPKLTGSYVAELVNDSASPKLCRPDDLWRVGGRNWRVVKIRPEPALVVFTDADATDDEPERVVLRVRPLVRQLAKNEPENFQ